MILAKIDSCWFLDIEENRFVRIHIVNPSHFSFGTAFITPRWMFVLAAATPAIWGDPILSDESLEPFDTDRLEKGDVVGIGIHTGNALVGYELGQLSLIHI